MQLSTEIDQLKQKEVVLQGELGEFKSANSELKVKMEKMQQEAIETENKLKEEAMQREKKQKHKAIKREQKLKQEALVRENKLRQELMQTLR